MPLGPVEIVVVQFPGNEVKGDIVPAIKALVENGTIRVIDILFITKDQDGNVTMGNAPARRHYRHAGQGGVDRSHPAESD